MMKANDHVRYRDTGSDWTVLRVREEEPAVLVKEGWPMKWGGRTMWCFADELEPVDP